MSKKILITGDEIFLNIKKLPILLEHLNDNDVYAWNNLGGFSYWLIKTAKEKNFPITPIGLTHNRSINRKDFMRRLIKEEKIEEYWVVTNNPASYEEYDDLNKLGLTVRTISTDFQKFAVIQ